jgi:hypothetical protein
MEPADGGRVVSRVDRVAVDGGTAWLWYLAGAVPGHLVSDPDQPAVPMYRGKATA